MFSPDDRAQLAMRGIDPERARAQLERIARGFPRIDLDRPCTVGDGILRLDDAGRRACLDAFDRARREGRISKFVPASGAASRMFQALLSVQGAEVALDPATLARWRDAERETEARILRGEKEDEACRAAWSPVVGGSIRPSDARDCLRFLEGLDEFPFAPAVAAQLGVDLEHGRDAGFGQPGEGDAASGPHGGGAAGSGPHGGGAAAPGLQAAAAESRPLAAHAFGSGGAAVLAATLGSPGLALAALPKGLIAFHRYDGLVRTAFGEHLEEAHELLGGGAHDPLALHFTVPSGLADPIREHLESVAAELAPTRFALALSVQSPATDTLAADGDGRPFRGADGQLVFRPGGHGALLENLAATRGDVVLIKNIDNIARRSWRRPWHEERKILAGLVVLLEERVDTWRRQLSAMVPGSPNPAMGGDIGRTELLDSLESAYTTTFSRTLPELQTATLEARVGRLLTLLDRPIRVCGMVPNEGEPGGGPFWVRRRDGSVDIQIVELSQIDRANSRQSALVARATHFNPVDLAVSLRDHMGRGHDLERFVDAETGIVAEKSESGRPLRALELPGLWNGSMADWNTVFLEIPLATFTPVKTVLDLLRPPHRQADGRGDE